MGYKKILRGFKKIAKQPVILKELFVYAKNDIFSFLRFYQYKHRIIFIAGLPKSGTTWLHTMLATIPGYNIRFISDPSKAALEHNICEHTFYSLPKYGYSVVKLHTRYSQENFRIIKKYLPKLIVTIRDLRDMCISRYLHIKHLSTHEHYKLYNELAQQEGIMHSIGVLEKSYVSWVRDWTNISLSHKDMIFLVKYEDLNRNTHKVLKEIMTFYDIEVKDVFLQRLSATKLNKNSDLKSHLSKRLPGRLFSTARKGVIGDWKNYFTDSHKQEFKRIAGDLLIDLGYESDLNW